MSELGFNLKVMTWFGFIAPDGRRVTLSRVVLFLATLAPCTLMSGLVIAHNGLQEVTFERAIVLWFHCTSLLKGVFRRVYFWARKSKLEDLIAKIEAPLESDSAAMLAAHAEMRVRSIASIRRFNRFVFSYSLCNALLTASLFSSRVAGKVLHPETPRSLLLPIWWPRDSQVAPDFYLLMVWQVCADLMYLGIANAPEALTCSLMMAASERAAMLSRVAGATLSPGPGGEVTAAFRDWVRCHLNYLSIVDGINDTMGLYIFMTYSFSLLNLVMYSFLFIQSTDGSVGTKVVLGLVGLLVRQFLYASAGQRVVTQSLSLRCSVFDAPQVSRGGLGGGPASLALQVLVGRLCGGAGPEEISGLGFFGVSLDMFTAVLSASFSHLLVMLQLNKSKL